MSKVLQFPRRLNAKGFSAAKTNNITYSMRSSVAPIDSDIRSGLRKLKARSRNEAQNNDYVKGFLRLLKNNTIGHKGVQLKPLAGDGEGKPDLQARKAINDAWTAWGKKGSCDVTGQYSWVGCSKLFMETLARDGEVLVREVPGWKDNKFRYAIQFLDTEMLDVEHNIDLPGGNVIRMSVEFNEWRRPVAYHLLTSKSTDNTYGHNGRRYQRIPADQIIHAFLPEWVWQTRGIPITTTALIRMNMLDGYEEAELVASRIGSQKMGFYVDKGEASYDISELGEQQDNGDIIQEAVAGHFEKLPQGVEVQTFDPQHPSTAYKDFIKTCLRGMATGLGIGYNNWVGDLEGVNLSSMRHGAENEREVWREMQRFFIESFCDPVYQSWLSASLLAQAITVAGKPLKLEREEKYANIRWQPRGWMRHDPLKDIQADERSFALKTKSISQIIRERGEDPDEVWNEISEDLKKLDSLGINFNFQPEQNEAETNQSEQTQDNQNAQKD